AWDLMVYIGIMVHIAPAESSKDQWHIIDTIRGTPGNILGNHHGFECLAVVASYGPRYHDVCLLDEGMQGLRFLRIVTQRTPIIGYTEHDGNPVFRCFQPIDHLVYV